MKTTMHDTSQTLAKYGSRNWRAQTETGNQWALQGRLQPEEQLAEPRSYPAI